jgi:hypothetical protein
MPRITFKTCLIEINGWTIVHLPLAASTQLPSRGLVMVKGTLNSTNFKSALEPDGRKSHWFEVGTSMRKDLSLALGENIIVEIEPTKDWDEPIIPDDILEAISSDTAVYETWLSILRWLVGNGFAGFGPQTVQKPAPIISKSPVPSLGLEPDDLAASTRACAQYRRSLKTKFFKHLN